MHSRYKLTAAVLFLAFVVSAGPVLAAPMEATISLGRDPEPPFCAQNPGGTVDITWNIEHTTTPNYVYYKLEDPTRTIIYEDSTYAGSSGITVARQWTVPVGAPDGKYWVRVEYWSFEAGNEANAEVTFYVCTGTGSICAEKWEDLDQDGQCDQTDAPVENWWICITTPLNDTFCKQTGPGGRVCWDGLPLGDYTVYEVPVGGWIPVGPTSFDVTLIGDPIELVFCNAQEPSAAEHSTWGRIKSIYR
jgi:hypothetical protein